MRYRRMSVIIRIGLMPSGQTSAHAPQVVHDQSVSAAIVSPCTFWPVPCVFITPTRSCTTLRGDSGLPASNAGQLSSHRPQETHASSSISWRREKSAMRPTPIWPVASTSSIDTGVIMPSVWSRIGEIDGSGERMQQPGVGHRGDETQREQRVRPPQGEMDRPGRFGRHANRRQQRQRTR